jgi:hypothetical protein
MVSNRRKRTGSVGEEGGSVGRKYESESGMRIGIVLLLLISTSIN